VNILDENIPIIERKELQERRVPVRQIGFGLGRSGMKDEEIIPFLHRCNRPTFFTRDLSFYKRRLCHNRYCLVYLDITEDKVAFYVRRFLRHPEWNSRAKRMGKVVRILPEKINFWRIKSNQEQSMSWQR
jgi:hypothetical protein